MENGLLTQAELAEKLRVSPRTLTQWRWLKKGPPWISLGYRSIRYDVKEVEKWLATRSGAN
jgi:predicted DNA-binding transcriptional regulator AlpA